MEVSLSINTSDRCMQVDVAAVDVGEVAAAAAADAQHKSRTTTFNNDLMNQK